METINHRHIGSEQQQQQQQQQHHQQQQHTTGVSSQSTTATDPTTNPTTTNHHNDQACCTIMPLIQGLAVALLVGVFVAVVGSPSLLLLMYSEHIAISDYLFIDPMAWLLVLWARQVMHNVVEQHITDDGAKRWVQFFLSGFYIAAVLVNGGLAVWLIPQKRDDGFHSPWPQQFIGCLFVVLTFSMLEAKWQTRRTVFGTPYTTWNAHTLALETKEMLGELKYVAAVSATLVGGLVRQRDCPDTVFFEYQTSLCAVDAESAVVYIWLWFLFFDVTLARIAYDKSFYSGVSSLMGLYTLAEHVLLMAERDNQSQTIVIFGYVRRAFQLLVVIIVLTGCDSDVGDLMARLRLAGGGGNNGGDRHPLIMPQSTTTGRQHASTRSPSASLRNTPPTVESPLMGDAAGRHQQSDHTAIYGFPPQTNTALRSEDDV